MLLVKVLCVMALFICVHQIDGHELYVVNNTYYSTFRKLVVKGIQECIEVCNQERKCGAFVMTGHAQCFIEDPTGNVTLTSTPGAEIMVKGSVNKCREDCPEGFTDLGLTGGCYYPVLHKQRNWHEAEAACQELDQRAHLISVDGPEEVPALTKFLAANHLLFIWAGGQDLDQDGMFTWIGSQEEIDPGMWLEGYPINDESKQCVIYFTSRYHINTVCNSSYYYVCEI